VRTVEGASASARTVCVSGEREFPGVVGKRCDSNGEHVVVHRWGTVPAGFTQRRDSIRRTQAV